jgi:hypothetical protein
MGGLVRPPAGVTEIMSPMETETDLLTVAKSGDGPAGSPS